MTMLSPTVKVPGCTWIDAGAGKIASSVVPEVTVGSLLSFRQDDRLRSFATARILHPSVFVKARRAISTLRISRCLRGADLAVIRLPSLLDRLFGRPRVIGG